MPLTKFKCRTHAPPPHFEVPLDHWAAVNSSGNAHPPHESYDPFVLSTIVQRQESDDLHVKTQLTPTTILGCPRKIIIERLTNYSAFPDDFLTAHIGSMAHDGFAATPVIPNHFNEELVSGTLFGLPFKGRIDRVDQVAKDRVRLVDYKFTSGSGMGWVPKDNDKVQLAMYKLLYEQTYPGVIADPLMLNYMAVGGAKKLPKQKFIEVKPMSEQEILAYQPHKGPLSVGEHIGELTDGFKHKDPKRLSLAGQSIKFGKHSMCGWCPVKYECLGRIEGRPSLIEEV